MPDSKYGRPVRGHSSGSGSVEGSKDGMTRRTTEPVGGLEKKLSPDFSYGVDRGEMMEGLRKRETPHDEPVEGVRAHDPVETAANPLLKGRDVPPDESPHRSMP